MIENSFEKLELDTEHSGKQDRGQGVMQFGMKNIPWSPIEIRKHQNDERGALSTFPLASAHFNFTVQAFKLQLQLKLIL